MVPGAVLGSYEIVSLLGSGGMGEVYRARDTRLGRDVALKCLPAAVADDTERLARFQREAQVLASLNHPNIGAIYGLEQLTSARFLVLELVEGGTLASRLDRGAVPLEEAIEIARQIALALQAAHDKGIVHRDLKPSNVAFTEAGDVKVLDFGLAKLDGRADVSATTASLTPTITSPALMTGVGALLGTAAYMSPEQARGKPADKRSDVWSFGCVLYEMMTGTRVFEDDDIADTLASVLKREPDWNRLPDTLPSAIRVLVRRCLSKDPRQRCGDMAAALILLEESTPLSAVPTSATPQPNRGLARRLAMPAAVILAAALAGVTTWWAMRPETPRIVRTSIVLTGIVGPTSPIAITPDGTRILYVNSNRTQLLVRALEELEPRPLVSGNNILNPLVSPDSQFVAYTDGTSLMRVALTGGQAITVTQVDGPVRGATWPDDDTIVFATANGTTGLQRVAASGGEVTVLTRPDQQRGEADHVSPGRLPGGRAVLFTTTSRTGGSPQIALLDLETGDRKSSFAGEPPRGTSKAVTSCSWPTESCRPCLSISRRGRLPAHRCRCFSNSRCSATSLRCWTWRRMARSCTPAEAAHPACRCGSITMAAKRRSRRQPLCTTRRGSRLTAAVSFFLTSPAAAIRRVDPGPRTRNRGQADRGSGSGQRTDLVAGHNPHCLSLRRTAWWTWHLHTPR